MKPAPQPAPGHRAGAGAQAGVALPGRRLLLKLGLAVPTWAVGPAQPATLAPAPALHRLLRSAAGAGSVLVLRHALAPGTFDPPGFVLGDCSTQRNLDSAGRRQAGQIGDWFLQRQLRPARLRSSPWCRCLETARLAFGEPFGQPVEAWAPLGSPSAGTEAVNAQGLAQLRAELAALAQRRAGFEVWVTHMFVISALVGGGVQPGEALLLGVEPDGTPRVIERWAEVAA